MNLAPRFASPMAAKAAIEVDLFVPRRAIVIRPRANKYLCVFAPLRRRPRLSYVISSFASRRLRVETRCDQKKKDRCVLHRSLNYVAGELTGRPLTPPPAPSTTCRRLPASYSNKTH